MEKERGREGRHNYYQQGTPASSRASSQSILHPLPLLIPKWDIVQHCSVLFKLVRKHKSPNIKWHKITTLMRKVMAVRMQRCV